MICYVDGGYDNVRKRNGYGSFAIFDDQDNQISLVRFKIPEANSNNEAEYISLITLLTWLEVNDMANQTDVIIIMTDSRLMVNQISGEWDIRADNLKPLLERVKLSDKMVLRWTPRKNIVKVLGH
jgi:ribonuclease HI